MPRIEHRDVLFSVSSRYFWARIDEINSDDDTADIVLVDSNSEDMLDPETGDPILIEDVPIFFHCDPDPIQRPNLALEGGSAAFDIDDIVYCRKSQGSFIKPFVIANSVLKSCEPPGLIIATPSGLIHMDPISANPPADYFRQDFYMRWIGNNRKHPLVQRTVGEFFLDTPCITMDGNVDKWAYENNKRRVAIGEEAKHEGFAKAFAQINMTTYNMQHPILTCDPKTWSSTAGIFEQHQAIYYMKDYAILFDKMFDLAGASDGWGRLGITYGKTQPIDRSDDDPETAALSFPIVFPGTNYGERAQTPNPIISGSARFFKWVNDERKNFHLIHELNINSDLNACAQSYASYCATNMCLAHDCDGRTPGERVSDYIDPWHLVGEVVVAIPGQDPPLSLNDVIDAMWIGWTESELHYAGLMNPQMNHIGFGYAFNAGWGANGMYIGVALMLKKISKGTCERAYAAPSYEGDRSPNPYPINLTAFSPLVTEAHPPRLSLLYGGDSIINSYKAFSAFSRRPSSTYLYGINIEADRVLYDPDDPAQTYILRMYGSCCEISPSSFALTPGNSNQQFSDTEYYYNDLILWALGTYMWFPGYIPIPTYPPPWWQTPPIPRTLIPEGREYFEYHPSGSSFVKFDIRGHTPQELYVDDNLVDSGFDPLDPPIIEGDGSLITRTLFRNSARVAIKSLTSIQPLSVFRTCTTNYTAVLYSKSETNLISSINQVCHSNRLLAYYFETVITTYLALICNDSVVDRVQLQSFPSHNLNDDTAPSCGGGIPKTISWRADSIQENFIFLFDGCISDITISYVNPDDNVLYSYAYEDIELGPCPVAFKNIERYQGLVEIAFGQPAPIRNVNCTSRVSSKSEPAEPWSYTFYWSFIHYNEYEEFIIPHSLNGFVSLSHSISMSEDGTYILVSNTPMDVTLIPYINSIPGDPNFCDDVYSYIISTDPSEWTIDFPDKERPKSVVQLFNNNLEPLTDPILTGQTSKGMGEYCIVN